jgi:hypothetical protein
MAPEKSTMETKEAKGNEPVAPAAPANGEVEALQKQLSELQKEIAKLKKDGGASQKIQVEGIFTGTGPTTPAPPVQQVIAQYEALERALQKPQPAWIFPGSVPAVPSGSSAPPIG